MGGLELPGDIEPHLRDGDSLGRMRGPAVYCLTVKVPDNVVKKWDSVFETRPDYLEQVRECSRTLYVGATGDLLGRLEDHRDSEVRKAALLQVCEIEGIREIWWFDDADRAFEREHGIAMQLANDLESTYVHSR